MLINLETWRQERITQQIFSFLERHPEVWRFPDQDAINAILVGRIGELSPQWNQMHAIYSYTNWVESPYDEATYRAVLEQPNIVHYTTLPKPWQRGCRHPLQQLFYQYLDMTAWQGWRNTVWRRAWRKLRTLQRLLCRKL